MSLTLRRFQALLIVLAITFVVAPLFAQVADTAATIPPPDPQAQFVLGLGTLAAFIGENISSFLLNLWNKAGGWLDGKANGLKMALSVFLTGALGLLVGTIAEGLTHSTNWIVTLALSIAAGVVGIVRAGMTIDAVKSKMTTVERSSLSGR